jgi:hypothetical protein
LKFSNSVCGRRATGPRRQACQDQLVSLLWTRPVQLSLHLAKVTL